MPTNFPEVWADRFIQNLTEASVAPWLDGIPELSANVAVINEGTVTEKNVIYVAATDFEVDVLINNNTYPIPVQLYDDDTLQFTLDKYQTKVTSISDDDVLGASYDKIDVVTKSHKRAILESKYQKAIHSLAPLTNTAATPVIVATGGPDGLKDGTRFRLTYEDLVAAKQATRGFKGEKRLVLTEEHFNDLLLDRKNFGDKLVNYTEGTTAPKIAGFRIYQYDGMMPIFTSALAKKAYGAILESGDREASVIFTTDAVAKKTGITKQYYAPAATNPTGQTNDLAYRHYFMAVPFRAEKIAAIISGTGAAPDPLSVTVTPATATTAQDSTVQFAAVVGPEGAAQEVVWTITTATELTISQTGLVTVGATTPTANYTVTATAAGTVVGTATLTVE